MSDKTLKQKQQRQDKEKQAYAFYVAQGWTPEQAIGIIGNIKRESGFNPNAIGDAGKAFGLAQWHPDRQAKAKSLYGNNWKSFENQLKFIDWELKNTEKVAGDKLKKTKGVWQAGQVVSDFYERPKVKFSGDETRQTYVADLAMKFKGVKLTPEDMPYFDASYANSVAPYMNQPQETITPTLNYFNIPKETPTFASVPDSAKEDKKETVEDGVTSKDVEEVETKTKEYNFLEALQNLQQEGYSHLQPEQVAQQQIVPQVDFNQQYEQVSQFIDEPLVAQQGLTWQEKLANRPRKPTVAEIIAEGDARKAQQRVQVDNTKVSNYNNARVFNPNVRNKTDKEIAQEREAKIQASVEAQKTPYTRENWRQQLASETAATGDKLRVSNEPNFFDDYLNPAAMIGSMATNLGQAPLQAQQSDSVMPYVTAIGAPLAVGALAGIGAKTTGQFANNIVNPLAGTGDLVNNLGNKYLPNAYKYNPMRFKASEDMGYRMLGKEGYEDAIETRVLRAKPIPNQPSNGGISLARNTNRNPNNGKMQSSLDRPYFADGFIDERYAGDYMASVNKLENNLIPIPTHKGIAPSQAGDIPLENATLYKKDWLQGYKQVEIPKKPQNFNSEINWGQWNKEIPENTNLLNEYNTIEQTSKADGSWMKNTDGSTFQGTPEQFVQQNSKNFKKAFPKGFEETYRGTTGESPNLKPNRAMFTGELEVAKFYSGRNNVDNILKSEEIVNEGGVHHFVYPKSENSLVHNTAGSHWTDVNLNSSETNIKNIDFSIQRLTEDIDRKQKMMREAFQNSDGSWSFPNSDLKLSNQLYKEGTSESERMLTKLKSQKNLIQNGEYTSNPTLLNKMKSDFGTDKVVTDDIAEYIEKNNIDNVTLRNIEDGIYGDISIINHKPGNYLKSFWGNNGMFDMNNPNIYKSVIPIAGASYLATQGQEEPKKLQQGGEFSENELAFLSEIAIKDNNGYWDKNNQDKVVEIQGNQITMNGVDQDLIGVSKETGEKKIMKPNKNYTFGKKTKNVIEIPLFNK